MSIKPHNTTVGTDNIIPTFEMEKWRHEKSSPMLKSHGQQGQGCWTGSRTLEFTRFARVQDFTVPLVQPAKSHRTKEVIIKNFPEVH